MNTQSEYESQIAKNWNSNEYQPYEQLPPYQQAMDNSIIFQRRIGIHALEDNNKTERLKSIWDLRRMRKYDYKSFYLLFDSFIYDFIEIYIEKQKDIQVINYSIRFLNELFDNNNSVPSKWAGELFETVCTLVKETPNDDIRNLSFEFLKKYLGTSDYCFILYPLKHIIEIFDEKELNYWINNLNEFLNNVDPNNLTNGVIWPNLFLELEKQINEKNPNKERIDLLINFLKALKQKFPPGLWESSISGINSKSSYFLQSICLN